LSYSQVSLVFSLKLLLVQTMVQFNAWAEFIDPIPNAVHKYILTLV